VLLGGILVILALYAAVSGARGAAAGVRHVGARAFRLHRPVGRLTRPTATAGYVVPTLVGAAAGAFALAWLARAAAGLGSPAARAGPLGGPASRGSRAFGTRDVGPA